MVADEEEEEEEEVEFYPGFFWEASWAEDEGMGDSAAAAALGVDSEALVAAASAGEEQAEAIRSFDFFE